MADYGIKISPLARAYATHYNQYGSGYPVFRGGIGYQSGDGVADLLRSAGKFFLPIAANAAQQFVESTSAALGEGKSIKTSATEAVKPTIMRAADQLTGAIMGTKEETAQKGSGRRRRNRRKPHFKNHKKVSFRSLLKKQTGSGRRSKRVYKARRKTKSLPAHRFNSLDSINF